MKTCPICSKKFASKKALTQHVASAHQQAKQQKRKPRARGGRKATTAGGSLSLSSAGSDIIATLSLISGTKAGTVLYSRAVTPHNFPSTRLWTESALWSRWKPTSLQVRVDGAGASTTFGAILLGWVADPSYPVRSGVQTVNVVGAMRPHTLIKLNSTGVINIPPTMARTWYEHEGAVETSSHGSIVAVAASDCGGYTGTLSMTLTLNWAVVFNGPEITLATSSPSKIHPDSGWSGLFTTSDGSWDSNRLTFKMTHGGNMVPFSAAAPGAVYSPATGTKVLYVKEDKSTGECKFFSLVVGYETPGLVLHATYADAVAYQQSGDATKILPYVDSSDKTTPDVPQFEMVTSDSSEVLLTSPDLGVRVSIMEKSLEAILERLNQLFRAGRSDEPSSFELIQ